MSGNGCEGGEEGGQAQIGIDFRWREEGRNEKGGGGGGRGRDDCTGKEGREGTSMPLRDSSGEFAVTSGRINLSTDHPIAGYCPLPVYSVRVFCGSFEPSIF
jgi:hypothetical protein